MLKIDTAVIFAGGRGTRLLEQTTRVPKPLVKLRGKPLLSYIINKLELDGIKKFKILTGYKSECFESYYGENKQELINPDTELEFIFTGLDSGTSQRLFKIKDDLREPFLLTYGDTLSDVNSQDVEEELYKSEDFLLSLCAIPKSERFGILTIDDNNKVESFCEKAVSQKEFINGGYICCHPDIFEYITADDFDFSRDVLEKKIPVSGITAHKYYGFWKAVDSQRDLEQAEDYMKSETKQEN